MNSCTIHNSESPFSWLEQNYTVGYPSNRALANPKKNKVLTHAALWINLRLKKARHKRSLTVGYLLYIQKRQIQRGKQTISYQ